MSNLIKKINKILFEQEQSKNDTIKYSSYIKDIVFTDKQSIKVGFSTYKNNNTNILTTYFFINNSLLKLTDINGIIKKLIETIKNSNGIKKGYLSSKSETIYGLYLRACNETNQTPNQTVITTINNLINSKVLDNKKLISEKEFQVTKKLTIYVSKFEFDVIDLNTNELSNKIIKYYPSIDKGKYMYENSFFKTTPISNIRNIIINIIDNNNKQSSAEVYEEIKTKTDFILNLAKTLAF